MAVYAVGDIQGCCAEFERLLKKIKFNPNSDQLWLVGDLVNRGPHSLETIELIQSYQDAVHCVLGNHDIHLIACYTGAQKCKPKSSLISILECPKAEQIIDWLRQQPLIHHDRQLNWTMVHAGLAPEWNLETAMLCAAEVELQLRDQNYAEFIGEIYGDTPDSWQEDLQGIERWRVIINACTRMRLCHQDGSMDFSFKGTLENKPADLIPWFDLPRASTDINIVFGHWSALGLKQAENLLGLDTGCLWGGQLTAARIDTPKPEIYSIDCVAKHKINHS